MGKSASRKVPDFLASVGYSLCHGPIDSINQIWVKDKPVLCGRFTENQVATVHLPYRFGGDDAEGGVSGAIELYLGGYDQVSSEAYAARFGFTSDTFPGHRGTALIWFRGAVSATPGQPLVGGFDEIDGTMVSRDNGGGFIWTSNNPYMPEVKVSVSCYWASLGEEYKSIPAPGGVSEDGSTWEDGGTAIYDDPSGSVATVELPDLNLTSNDIFEGNPNRTTVDLRDHMTEEQIDTGNGQVYLQLTGTCSSNAATGVKLGFYPDDGTGNPDYSNPIPGTNDEVPGDTPGHPVRTDNGGFFSGYREHDLTASIPPGTRIIEYIGYVVFVIPLGSSFTGATRTEQLMVPEAPEIIGYTYCEPDGTMDGFAESNPSHWIYECLVNSDWGRGEDPSAIDVPAFEAMAETLYNERFGYAVQWVQQDTIQNVIQDTLDTIKAFLFLNPQTGLWQPRLLRNDYDPEEALVVNESNCKATKRKRRAWGETINEIVVSYTDPNTEESVTVSAQDDGNIGLLGEIISETREYSGIRNRFLAQFVADRDVLEAAYPLYSAVLEMDRSFWSILPGDVLNYSWEDDEIESMIVRVMDVNYGKPTDRVIKVKVVEDIFAIDQTAYSETTGSTFDPERAAPIPFDYELMMTTPLPVLQQNGIDVDELDDEYPNVGVMAHGDHADLNAIDFDAHTTVTLGTGSTAIQAIFTSNKQEATLLTEALVPEVTSRIDRAVIDGITFGTASEGDILMVGLSEDSHEFMMLAEYHSGDDEWEVNRGLWDTIPGSWPIGTVLWAFDDDGSTFDQNLRAAGEERTYRLLPRTTEGRLEYGDAADLTITISERPHRPFRPADTQLDGAGFETLTALNLDTEGQFTATWANRDRRSEDVIAMKWDDETVVGEAGQTTTLRVYDLDDVLIVEYTGEAGTSKVIPFTDFSGGEEQGYVEFIAVNSIGESMWNARRYFDIRSGDMSSTTITMDSTAVTMDRA